MLLRVVHGMDGQSYMYVGARPGHIYPSVPLINYPSTGWLKPLLTCAGICVGANCCLCKTWEHVFVRRPWVCAVLCV